MYVMHDNYTISGTSNICPRELDGPEYNTPDTWPSFQEDWIKLKQQIITDVKEHRTVGKVYLRIFDGEFWFLKGEKVGNVGRRHCSKQLTPQFIKKFYEGFLCADVVATQLYADQMTIYHELFPQRPIDIPMELIYCLVSSRWIFKQFPDSIALIGGDGKMDVIKKLMEFEDYRNYLGIQKFVDYIPVPERFACDDTDTVFDLLKLRIQQSNAKIFLFGIGISKLAIAHKFKYISNAVFIDVGCGISALSGTTSNERPYFGSWINYRLRPWDYSHVDPMDFDHKHVRYIDIQDS